MTVSPSRSASLNSTRYRMFMLSRDDRGPEMNPAASEVRPRYTAKQGQYLAFIHAYRRLHGRAPAEADIQRFFRVSPPSVHQMILKLEQAGLITRQPGVARSITLAVDPKLLPELESGHDQPVRTSVQGY
jgi:DNA-binding MarR family transcriptional regulator